MKITRSKLKQIIREELNIENSEQHTLNESAVTVLADKLASEIPWKDILKDNLKKKETILFIAKNAPKIFKKWLEQYDVVDRGWTTWANVLWRLHKDDKLKGAYLRGFKSKAGEELSDDLHPAKIAVGMIGGADAVSKKIADHLEFYD
jgi:hypothetical protein